MDPSLRQLGALRKGGGGGDAAVAGGEEQIINPKDGNNEEEAPRDKQQGYKAIITFCAGCRRREVARGGAGFWVSSSDMRPSCTTVGPDSSPVSIRCCLN